MKIEVYGTGESKIEITTQRQVGNLNTQRDAALLAEALFWNLPQETLAKFMGYLTKKIMEMEVDKNIMEILHHGEPAIVVVYPTGDRAVMTEDEVIEMLSRDGESRDHDPATLNVVDEDEDYDGGIPEE